MAKIKSALLLSHPASYQENDILVLTQGRTENAYINILIFKMSPYFFFLAVGQVSQYTRYLEMYFQAQI